MSQTKTSCNFVNYFLLFGIGLIWGFQYFLTKIALKGFSPWMITAGRVTIGAILLTLVLATRIEKPLTSQSQRSFWRCLPDFILIGFFEATLPCLLITWAQEYVPISVTAILIGTVPLFATLLESFFVTNHTISEKKIVAILIGLLGVLVLVAPDFCVSNTVDATAIFLPLLPVLALLLAALSYSISILLIKTRLPSNLPPIHSARGILVGAMITALPLFLLLRTPWIVDFFPCSHSAIWALILLGIFGGGISYTLYVRLIDRTGPSFASTANYLALSIGAFIGIAFAQEKLTFNVICSFLLILATLWLLSDKEKRMMPYGYS